MCKNEEQVKELASWLKSTLHMKIRHRSDSLGNMVLENKKIIVAVFSDSNEQWYTNCNAKICAESVETFNKWSQVYYKKDYPTTPEEKSQMIVELISLSNPEHIEKANNFETYSR